MIYIQSNNERTLPHHFDCSCALYGAIENCFDYRLTTYDELISGKYDNLIKTNLFVGSVEFMREVYRRVNKDIKLPSNSNRKHEIITLEEAYKRTTNGKLFIKPIEVKLFTGLILDGMVYSCLSTLPNDTKVLAYDVFDSDINSEWRVYVYNNKIMDSRNYSGDFKITPDYNYVEDVIKLNKETFPIAYTIDVGVLESKENVVIEYNDMWSIGNYGLDNRVYLRLLRERYFQIMRDV